VLEDIPAGETTQIENITKSTLTQLKIRYTDGQRVLRGVHAKDHGCVTATFKIVPDIPDNFRQGVFQKTGHEYKADVRFSNAAVLVAPDSPEAGGERAHGSRGMAIKVHGVEGSRLVDSDDSDTQDFLMINQPVFAFANVEDYEALSKALEADTTTRASNGAGFFARLPDGTSPPTPSQLRAAKTAGIIQRIRSLSTDHPKSPAFQEPPASPVDNDYFGASPFMLGSEQVMRFRVRTAEKSSTEPNVVDDDYLRTALRERLCDTAAGEVVFHFEVQARPTNSIVPATDIENASDNWPEDIPFHELATLTIPPQEFDTDELKERCERLIFSPWQGLQAHRPLGGINRLRKTVYEASVKARLE
jgi:hypothetical protein